MAKQSNQSAPGGGMGPDHGIESSMATKNQEVRTEAEWSAADVANRDDMLKNSDKAQDPRG